MVEDEHARDSDLGPEAAEHVLSALAHKLGSPLGAIINYGYLLSEELAGRLSATERGWMERVVEAAGRAKGLLAESRRFVEAMARPILPARLGLSRHLATSIEERLVGARVELDAGAIPAGLEVRADAGALADAIEDLVGLLVALSGDGVRPVVRVGARRDDDLALVTIEGRGIRLDGDGSLERTLEPFAVGPRVGRDGVELGVRYQVARVLLARQGGSVQAVRSPDNALTWEVRLPLAAP